MSKLLSENMNEMRKLLNIPKLSKRVLNEDVSVELTEKYFIINSVQKITGMTYGRAQVINVRTAVPVDKIVVDIVQETQLLDWSYRSHDVMLNYKSTWAFKHPTKDDHLIKLSYDITSAKDIR